MSFDIATMTQDLINRLPTELLCRVFDYLNYRQQCNAMQTCLRWNGILSSDVYINHRRLVLSLDNLCYEVCGIDKVKRYRSLKICDRNESIDPNQSSFFLAKLRQILFCNEVRETLEELHIVASLSILLSDLIASKNGLYLPKLRSLTVSSWIPTPLKQQDLNSCRLIAPNLRCLDLQNSYMTLNVWLVHPFSEQINKLRISFCTKIQLFATLGDKPFVNLHSLTLDGCSYLDHDYTPMHKQIFSQLKYLNTTGVPINNILREARNLETLIINAIGAIIGEDTFDEIHDLNHLTELHLNVEIVRPFSFRRLSLPRLEKLTICYSALSLLGSVPKLRSLCIKHHGKISLIETNNEKLAAFSMFNRRLEVLKLVDLHLDSTMTNQICSLTKLRALQMIGVKLQQLELDTIFKSLKQLQEAHLENCQLMDGTTCNDATKNISFVGQLKQRNVACRISLNN